MKNASHAITNNPLVYKRMNELIKENVPYTTIAEKLNTEFELKVTPRAVAYHGRRLKNICCNCICHCK